MSAIIKFSYAAIFCLLWVCGFNTTAQLNYTYTPTYKPKDIRVPLAKITLSDSNIVYGYAMAISNTEISLHQAYENPANIWYTKYHYSEIDQIQYFRKGDFKAGFNRGFWPFEILFASAAIQNWDDGWGALILMAGTFVSLPPAIILGIVENSYKFNKTYEINQSQEAYANHYRFLKNRIKPDWRGITQTQRGKDYLTEIINQELNYQVNYQPKWQVSFFSGINYSTFNQAFNRAYAGTHQLTSQSSSLQSQFGFGIAHTINQKIELGYKFADGQNYEYVYNQSNPSGFSNININLNQSNHSFYVVNHFKKPDFDKTLVRLSAGIGLNLAEIDQFIQISAWDNDSEMWGNNHTQKSDLRPTFQLITRSEFFWNEKLAVFFQSDVISPVKIEFDTISVGSPVFLSIADFDFRYFVFAFNYGINYRF